MDDLINKAEHHMELGEYQQARKIYNEILLIDPNNARAYNKLGVISAREENLEQAKIYFIKALELNPKLSSASSNLGNIYFETGDFEKAKDCYEKAIALDPDNPVPYNNLAVIYKKSKDIDKFVKFYKKSVELSTQRLNDITKMQLKKKETIKSPYMAIFGFIIVVLVLYLLISFIR
ncbi:MAG: tetratricopeptide repeat protein [Tepidanaerobacter acetatoxydans]|uniref:tetratricopeptide repeat protein n=1 Tax=Tepidanaerobacter TaxID=499228 RepID=UPI000AE91DF1|nr:MULTISPECIES: tetratricopeptide repeat protein [Tepidanaerobacter]NLU10420.1 tetratricopeptide repeat protein [Tepidanaerobacter acetatoxydans]